MSLGGAELYSVEFTSPCQGADDDSHHPLKALAAGQEKLPNQGAGVQVGRGEYTPHSEKKNNIYLYI